MIERTAPAGNANADNLVIAVACDHVGFELKETLKSELVRLGFEVIDLGTNGSEAVDYPDFGNAMAAALSAGPATRGIIMCGSGIGISIAANRHQHVRAALCVDESMARMARRHNDANVLALGARVIDADTAKKCMTQFLETPFEGGRHARRVDKLSS